MASLTLAPHNLLAQLSLSNNQRRMVRKQLYRIIYNCLDGVQNSIYTEILEYKSCYTLLPKRWGRKPKVRVRIQKNTSLLFGAMKLLDALGIEYLPDSVRVRLVKA